MVQNYIKKTDEVSYDGISINKGKEALIITEAHQKYLIADKYSPYWDVYNCNDTNMERTIRDIIKEIKYEGIFEFEFIVDCNNKMWFLEINFRNTALGYSTTVAGMPQVVIWCESMEKGELSRKCIKPVPEGFTAMAECFDYDARVKQGLINKRKWIEQYKTANCKLYKGHDDYLPFFTFMLYKLKSRIKKSIIS